MQTALRQSNYICHLVSFLLPPPLFFFFNESSYQQILMRIIPLAEIKNLVSSRSSPEQEDVKVMIPCPALFSALLSRKVEVMIQWSSFFFF